MQPAMPNQKRDDFSVKNINPSIPAKKPRKGPATSFYLVEEMLYLYVTIEKARGIPVLQTPGLQVVVKIGNYVDSTFPTAQNQNGEFLWHQSFAFTKSKVQDQNVEVSLMPAASSGGSKLSFSVVDAQRRAPPNPPLAAEWYRLKDAKGNVLGGELMMAFWIGTQADEVYNAARHSDAAVPLSPDGLSSICPRVYNTPRLWYLRFNVIEVRDLMINGSEMGEKVFVEASVEGCTLTTTPCLTRTNFATWNQDLMFVVEEPFDAALVVAVRKAPVVVDGVMKDRGVFGMCKIPLKKVPKRLDRIPVTPMWKDLTMELQGEGEEKPRFASKINTRISLDGGYHVSDDPSDFISDFRPSEKRLCTPSVGTFELGILSASGLSPIMSKNSVDAFCVAKYGPKWVRTRTSIGDRFPQWNEQYTWEVYDHCTVVTIAVFENKYLLGGGAEFHRRIGKVRIRLSDLAFDKVYTNSHTLVMLDPSGARKQGELQLSYRFRSPSKLYVYATYGQSLLPKMHHTHPLSIPQLRILKAQAVALTQKRLHKAQLGQEVVSYVLSDDKDRFSFRRAKANFDRCMKLAQSVSHYMKLFDHLRKWSNPYQTGPFVLCLMFGLFFPSVTLATIFFVLSCIVLWGFSKKSPLMQLPHVDTEISQVYGVDPDDIAEEFDGRCNERRYARMKHVLCKVQVMLGDIAAAGERVQSLLSWRDGRATSMVVMIGSVMAVVVYFCLEYISWRLVYLATMVWTFRPPQYRGIRFPSVFSNLIRRMPSKMDNML